MSRSLTIGILLAVFSPVVAHAQSAWEVTEHIGAPVIAVATPPLVPGHVYRFETYDLHQSWPGTIPDTVLTIRASNDVNVGSLAGSDGCEDPTTHEVELERSCANFRPSVTLPPMPFFVWVRALSPSTFGLTSIRMRDVTTNEAFHDLVTQAHFGGRLIHGLGTPSDRVQIETAQVPGSTESNHAIVLALDNTHRYVNWFLGFRFGSARGVGSGAVASHRSFVRGTAQYTGGLVPSSYPGDDPIDDVLIAPFTTTGEPEPYRVLRNDCVQPAPNRLCSATVDADRDSLGDELEGLVLHTCDRASDPDAGGISCAHRFGCADGESCNEGSSTSDTDGDGFRDDLELYGFQFWDCGGPSGRRVGCLPDASRANFAPGGYFPTYGASPAHYDTFVDYNYLDADPGTPACDPPAPVQAALNGVGGIYRGATHAALDDGTSPERLEPGTSTIRNRDGTRGIHVHTDTYHLPAPSAPSSRDLSAGNWQGSAACQAEPTSQTDCTSMAGTWDADTASCASWDVRTWLTGDSQWIWRTAFDRGASGAQNGYPNYYISSGGAALYAHEMGHVGALMHGGTFFSRSAVDAFNGSAATLSRMSYVYDSLDATEHLVTFDEGGRPALHARYLSEQCPYGMAASGVSTLAYQRLAARQSSFFFGRADIVQLDPSGGCPAVDWNRDGVISTDPVEAAAAAIFGHVERAAPRDRNGDGVPDQLFLSETGDALVSAAGQLIRVQIQARPPALQPEIRIDRSRTFVCAEEPAPTGPRYPACGFDSPTDDLFELATRPAAVTAAVVTNAGRALLVLVWVEDDGRMLWATVDPTNAHSLSFGSIDSHASLASMATLEGMPALARLGTTGRLALVYRDGDDETRLVEQVGHFDGPSHLAWDDPTTAFQLTAPSAFVGGVGVTHLDGSELGGPGAVLSVAVILRNQFMPIRLNFLQRSATAAGWSRVSSVLLGSGIVGRPTLAARPYSTAGVRQWRMVATFRVRDTATGVLEYLESDLDVLGGWSLHAYHANQAVPNIRSASAASLAWDERAGVTPGLRGTYNQLAGCPADVEVGSPCPTPGTICRLLDDNIPGVGTESTTPVCGIPGTMLSQAIDFTVPGADGVVPMGHESFDEWSAMADGFCAATAAQAGLSPSAYAIRGTCPDHPDP
ncbi:MAG: hypothetical protein U0234_25505 [Sandaracinus sp.]